MLTAADIQPASESTRSRGGPIAVVNGNPVNRMPGFSEAAASSMGVRAAGVRKPPSGKKEAAKRKAKAEAEKTPKAPQYINPAPRRPSRGLRLRGEGLDIKPRAYNWFGRGGRAEPTKAYAEMAGVVPTGAAAKSPNKTKTKSRGRRRGSAASSSSLPTSARKGAKKAAKKAPPKRRKKQLSKRARGKPQGLETKLAKLQAELAAMAEAMRKHLP